MNWYKRAKALKAVQKEDIFYRKFDKVNFSEKNTDLQKQTQIKKILIKQASMSVYVKGFEYPREFKTIMDICYYLSGKIYPLMKEYLTPDEMLSWNDNGLVSDFFAPDGDTFDKPVGIINNYVKAFPPQKISWLLGKTKEALREINIYPSSILHETFKDSNEIRVIRWVIKSNPNAFIRSDIPNLPNFSNTNASVLLRVLGHEGDIEGGGHISAKQALDKITQIEGNSLILKDFLSRKYGPAEGSSLISDIRNRLPLVKEVAQWAVNHGYQEIYFA